MTEQPPKVHIELALTPRQKRQIREATGREVNTLELQLAPLPRPAGPPAREEEEPGFGTTDDHTPRRRHDETSTQEVETNRNEAVSAQFRS